MYYFIINLIFYSIFIKDVTVTNDGATILKLLEVEHPAGKILVDLAQLQDEEVFKYFCLISNFSI